MGLMVGRQENSRHRCQAWFGDLPFNFYEGLFSPIHFPPARNEASKAFKKEDDALPERFIRMRSTSGLPPDAVNYMTADGARRVRTEFAGTRDGNKGQTDYLQ